MLANKALSAAPSAVPLYIEDTFSTYLYTGTGSTQTITNNIDLSGQGGLVWLKNRSVSSSHRLVDTDRGALSSLFSESTSAASTRTSPNTDVDSFSSTGFVAGNFGSANGNNWCSWTFRKAKKFFDVVTFNADLSKTNQRISHNLGSVPGTIIIKCTNVGGSFSDWWTYHRSLGRSAYLTLNSTTASTSSTNFWGTSDPTSTDFGFNAFDYGLSGGTYVAYLFAHDAGGFGDAGSDNVITCGSFTTDGSGLATVNLGYEPQWVMVKRTDGAGSWFMHDTMRGYTADTTSGTDAYLLANTSGAEVNTTAYGGPNATGFTAYYNPSQTYIYIAIRRGPMKTPTSGTSVFNAITRTGTGAAATISGIGFAPDLVYPMCRNDIANKGGWVDKLRGASANLTTNLTDAESTNTQGVTAFGNTSISVGTSSFFNGAFNYVNYFFRRAPGFFDVVCYTGTGSATTVSHNLGVAPELMIVKWRSGATGENWSVLCTAASSSPDRRHLYLDLTSAGGGTNNIYSDSSGTPVMPTASVFSIGSNSVVNKNAATYVAYLFASLTGISKVGTYTGNGSNQTINCGFTAGARFILIKRTDSTGDWYVYDSARGIVSGNDPQLKLNSTAAEATGYDAVDPDNSGFIVNNDATNFPINVNTATYIYLAIA